MEKLVKIGEIMAETPEMKELLRETLENSGFVVADYPEDTCDDWLVILKKCQ